MNARIDWIAVDWGTSNLRAWAIDADGRILAHASSADGMAKLTRDAFEPALLALIDGWLPADRRTCVVACGMVGARQGWIEAPYATSPCAPVTQSVRPACRDPRLDMRILAGIRQDDPPDVMRGEETQIAGVLLRDPVFAGTICLPGTHTKWVRVAGGSVQSFRTFMTGELYSLLSTQSVLRHSVPSSGDANEGWDDAAFAAAVTEGAEDGGALAAGLFSVRAGTLIADLTPSAARARLSGLLIGAEVAAVSKDKSDMHMLIVGNGRQAKLYAQALTQIGATSSFCDADELTLAGLKAAKATMREHEQ